MTIQKRLKLIIIIVLGIVALDLQGQDVHDQFHFKSLTIEQGLSNNRTLDITKDKKGFIWIATDDGVSRFDGNHILNYNSFMGDSHDQWNQQITALYTDNEGNLWQGALNLFKFNYEKDKFEFCFNESVHNQPKRIREIKQYQKDEIWIGARNGVFKFNNKTCELTQFPPDQDSSQYEIWTFAKHNNKLWLGTRRNGLVIFDLLNHEYSKITLYNEKNEQARIILSIYIDKKGIAWIGTKNNGIYKVDTYTQSVISHDYPDENCRRIRKITKDNKGNMWIGTMEGLYVIYNGSNKYIRYAHTQHEFSRITHNSVFNIFIDNHDNMWLCTYAGGVNYTNMNRKPFTLYREKENDNRFINNNIIAGFAHDQNGNLYIGTDHGGLNILDKQSGRFRYITHGTNKISGTNIKCLLIDENKLWIGTYGGGVTIYNVEQNSFEYIKSDLQTPDLLSSNTIYSLARDKETGNIWVGTDGGVDLIDHNTYDVSKVLYNGSVNHIYSDHENTIWVGGTGEGLYKFNRKTKKFDPCFRNLDVFSIYWITVDSKNNLWIGGKDGLSYIRLSDSSLIKHNTQTGFASNIIFGILEDEHKNIWVSTTGGLVKCINAVENPENFETKTYTRLDGLQSNQFWRNAAYKSGKGEFYFGGVNGFNSFFPDSIKQDRTIPDITITGLKIANKYVKINQKVEGKVILKKSIGEVKELHLSHKHKVFTLEFEALHYANSDKNKYAYMLTPFDDDWNYAESPINFITYTSLRGGKYIFRLKAANSDGVWNDEYITMKINIKPPFWKTWYFIAFAGIVIMIFIFIIHNMRMRKIENNNRLLESTVVLRTKEISKMNNELFQQKEQLQDLNSLKDKFFSIVAHDLKSPFQTLIGFSSFLEKKYDGLGDDKRKEYIGMIHKASSRIYNLLENLLTWSRNQTNGITFNPEMVNLSQLIKANIRLHQQHYSKQNIHIVDNLNGEIMAYVDENMFDTVLRNLISNAIKFSKDNDEIVVSCKEYNEYVELFVKDNGIGISKEDQKNLFKLANQTTRPGTHGEKGTGLGLIICAEFIKKHRGSIWVDSFPGKGSTFYFTVPKKPFNVKEKQEKS